MGLTGGPMQTLWFYDILLHPLTQHPWGISVPVGTFNKPSHFYIIVVDFLFYISIPVRVFKLNMIQV